MYDAMRLGYQIWYYAKEGNQQQLHTATDSLQIARLALLDAHAAWPSSIVEIRQRARVIQTIRPHEFDLPKVEST